jgi:hypothetical protein
MLKKDDMASFNDGYPILDVMEASLKDIMTADPTHMYCPSGSSLSHITSIGFDYVAWDWRTCTTNRTRSSDKSV